MRRLLVCGSLLVVLAACGGGAEPGPSAPAGGYTNISVQELQQMLQQKDFTLVNTHIPFEGDLPQTDLSIPYDEIGNRLDELPGKDTKIVLYCRSGSMSTDAAEVLVQAGYTDVYELDGGMIAWERAGLPVEGR